MPSQVVLYTPLAFLFRNLQHSCVFLRAVGVNDGRCERDGAKISSLGGSPGGERRATPTDCEGWETIETNARRTVDMEGAYTVRLSTLLGVLAALGG